MPRRLVRLLALLAAPLSAQTPLDRSHNLGGTWIPDRGAVQFNFLHRFYVSPSPNYVVTNFPTFTLAVGLPHNIALGLRYATKSSTPSTANETELYGRWRLWGGSRPLALSWTPAYNTASNSADFELAADWTRGRITLSGAGRAMRQPYGVDRARLALAGGAVIRLNPYVAIAGDVASLVDAASGEDPAWSAGLLLAIPSSPHTFSLHASNVGVNTVAGSSRGGGTVLYGFEFTIPLHLKRFSPWFHGAPQAAATSTEPADVERAIQHFSFGQDTVVIQAGQAVAWTNKDAVEHSVNFTGGEGNSPLLATDRRWVHRFERAGTFEYACAPHPYMKGVVVVR